MMRFIPSFFLLAACFFIPMNTHANYSYIDEDIREELAPYLIPEDHPIKLQLDALFSSSRVSLSLKSLIHAGFKTAGARKFTQIIVAFHPAFPEYLCKLFVDAQRYEKKVPVYEYWANRVRGARLIQQEIAANGWEHLFKVPKKWVYILPENPKAPAEFIAKNFILVEDNMDIYPNKENEALWKSSVVSQELLDAFFILISTLGLRDTLKPENAPFSRDGRIAFIDTQMYNMSVDLKFLLPFLSKENRLYWKLLIDASHE